MTYTDEIRKVPVGVNPKKKMCPKLVAGSYFSHSIFVLTFLKVIQQYNTLRQILFFQDGFFYRIGCRNMTKMVLHKIGFFSFLFLITNFFMNQHFFLSFIIQEKVDWICSWKAMFCTIWIDIKRIEKDWNQTAFQLHILERWQHTFTAFKNVI